jgi:nicotinic acid phosphoribosyltransferase
MFAERFERLSPINVFLDVYTEIEEMLSKLQRIKKKSEYFEELYKFQEFLSDYIDDLEEKNFDVSPQEMSMANEILKYITVVETQLYYLLLVYETLEYTELTKIGINDMDSKPLVLERDERIQMVEALNSARIKS